MAKKTKVQTVSASVDIDTLDKSFQVIILVSSLEFDYDSQEQDRVEIDLTGCIVSKG